ncbi:MAG: hypothetical protein PHF79_02035 [Candidatus Pacebacteria bacterium]|nr:hypothetical protein [Candidatus Paceibacterota bacterium]
MLRNPAAVLGYASTLFVNSGHQICQTQDGLRRAAQRVRSKISQITQKERLSHVPCFDMVIVLKDGNDKRPFDVRDNILEGVRTTVRILEKKYLNQNIGSDCIESMAEWCKGETIEKRILIVGNANLVRESVFAVTDQHDIPNEEKRVCDDWTIKRESPFGIYICIRGGYVRNAQHI